MEMVIKRDAWKLWAQADACAREGTWGSETNALTKMKSQWKSIFENKADEIFDVIIGNQNLKSSIFGTLNGTQSRAAFNRLVQDTDDKLFKFIIVE